MPRACTPSIYKLLAATWVKLMADAAAVGQGDEAATKMLRRDSALEKVFRAEAAKLARLHAHDDLTQAFGGATQVSAEAQQGFIAQRAQRYAQRQQTFLTGVLTDWDADRGSLYTFISRAAASFLMDMHREFRADGEAKLVQGATPARWATAPDADGPDAAASDADWLDAQHRNHSPSAEEVGARQRAALALDAAVQKLPDDLQRLFRMERSKLDFGLSDTELARSLGLGSRNSLAARRKRPARGSARAAGRGLRVKPQRRPTSARPTC